MKTRRVIRWSLECLTEGNKTTEDIKDFINQKSNHGTTGHGLANILGKDWRFQKAGETFTDRGLGRYKVTVWSLSTAFRDALSFQGIVKRRDYLKVVPLSVGVKQGFMRANNGGLAVERP